MGEEPQVTWNLPVSLRQLRRAWRVVAFAAPVAGILFAFGLLALPSSLQGERAHCADLVADQLTTTAAVKGSFGCLGGNLAVHVAMGGVRSDQGLARAIGSPGRSEYVGRSADGEYLYELVYDDGKVASIAFKVVGGKVVDAG